MGWVWSASIITARRLKLYSHQRSIGYKNVLLKFQCLVWLVNKVMHLVGCIQYMILWSSYVELIFLCSSIAKFIFTKNSTVKPHVSERRCSVCRPFMLCCSATFLLTFRQWLRRIGMRPRGWLVGFFHRPIEHVTLSTIKLSFANWGWPLTCVRQWRFSAII